jgi:hypothetical protein
MKGDEVAGHVVHDMVFDSDQVVERRRSLQGEGSFPSDVEVGTLSEASRHRPGV